MGSIDRHIFRTTLASFALVLVSLMGVIWITQALRGNKPNAGIPPLSGRPATA